MTFNSLYLTAVTLTDSIYAKIEKGFVFTKSTNVELVIRFNGKLFGYKETEYIATKSGLLMLRKSTYKI